MTRRKRTSKFAIDITMEDKALLARLIVKDLTRKYPRGLNGYLTKYDYHSGERNPLRCFDRSAERENVGQYCGYDEDLIFSIFLKEDLEEGRGRLNLRDILEENWHREQQPYASDEEIEESLTRSYWVPEATMTRRDNRVRDRLNIVRRAIRATGRPGIYKINTGYRTKLNDVDFYVWANSNSDAKGQFDTLTKPLIAAIDDDFEMSHEVSINQQSFNNDPSTLLESTQKTINDMNTLEARLKRDIDRLTKSLDGLQGIKGMVTDMAVNSICAS